MTEAKSGPQRRSHHGVNSKYRIIHAVPSKTWQLKTSTERSTFARCTYLLLIRRVRTSREEIADFRSYFRMLAAADCEVMVVDGSPPAVFAEQDQAWRGVCRHLAVDPRYIYLGFLGNVEKVGTWKIQQRGGVFVNELKPLFTEVMASFGQMLMGAASRQAVTLEENDDDASQMLTFLSREMQFFDRLVSPLRLEGEPQNDSNDVSEALGTAKTIKESVEKWLKKRLPKGGGQTSSQY